MEDQIPFRVAEEILVKHRIPKNCYTIAYDPVHEHPNRVIFAADIAKYIPKRAKLELELLGYLVTVLRLFSEGSKEIITNIFDNHMVEARRLTRLDLDEQEEHELGMSLYMTSKVIKEVKELLK